MATFELHPIVKELAGRLTLVDGKIELDAGALAKGRARLLGVKDDERKQVLVSLVALAAKMKREASEGTEPAIERLLELATGLVQDAEKARAIFAEAGHGLPAAKPKGTKKKR